jgi:two-component system, NarL family, sensor histidine kinase DegS
LKWLVNDTTKENHIHVDLIISCSRQEYAPPIEVNLFRVIQEALHNIERHSGASEVLITLEEDNGLLKITIRDNGQGFTLPEKTSDLVTEGKLGIIGMQERIRSLGGEIGFNSNNGEGTLISVKVPIPENGASGAV